jgi:serine/threonine-protein kinase
MIGHGGMSTVWLATDQTLGKQWAVKQIKLSSDPKERQLVVDSLVDEANLLKRLDHAAIPRIVDLIDEEGTLFVVMDYVEGKTLAEILAERGPQSEDDVMGWALQLCDVLDYLHQREPAIVYRDMKPSNVMLKPDGTVRLIDFGIACEEGTVVSEGATLGSKGFAAPEQSAVGTALDRRADVYGLGATMYDLLTGEVPPTDHAPIPLRQKRPELSQAADTVVSKAMEKDPDDRYPGAAEMAYAIDYERENDEHHRRSLVMRWHGFLGTCIAAAACLAVGLICFGVRNYLLSSDFGYWMQVAAQSVDEGEAESAYANAANALPSDTRPYLGLIDLYRSDGTFTDEEESSFESLIVEHQADLTRDENAWADLSFNVGKLYWYYYDPAGADDVQEYARVRAAESWMENAASVDSYGQKDVAATYADIASFNSEIVPLINEGSDAGRFAPYFSRLSTLVDMVGRDGTDVMRLETANLALDALRTYPRKFRADGVGRDDMHDLADRAIALAEGVTPTTDRLDQEKQRALGSTTVDQEIDDAFVDVGVIS